MPRSYRSIILNLIMIMLLTSSIVISSELVKFSSAAIPNELGASSSATSNPESEINWSEIDTSSNSESVSASPNWLNLSDATRWNPEKQISNVAALNLANSDAQEETNTLVIGLKSANEGYPNAYSEVSTIASRYRAQIINNVWVERQTIAVVVKVSPETKGSFVAEIQTSNSTSYVENQVINYVDSVPNDPFWPLQWGPEKIGVDFAWNTTTGSSSLLVAVIDTGIDYNHPDLRTNYVPLGYDWINFDSDPLDDFGHGTHCAGIIAAEINNTLGVAGIAQVQIMAEKCLGSNGYGSSAACANAIYHAVNCGAKILSLSWGSYNITRVESDAINYALDHGVIIIAAAGNGATSDPHYPAAFDGVIGVGATNITDTLASWSNHGDYVDISAPGVRIYSTMPTYNVTMNGPPHNYDLNYSYMNGTSMATPMVAGVAALIWSRYPYMSSDFVRYQLLYSSDDLGAPGVDPNYGVGRVNAQKAVQDVPSHAVLLVNASMPEHLRLGVTATFNATAFNWGSSLENNVQVQLIANGTVVNFANLPLVSGAFENVVLSWAPTVPGIYNLTICVVPVEGQTIASFNSSTENVVAAAEPSDSAWTLLAMDPDEGEGTNLKAVYAQVLSDVLYFKVNHYRNWTSINDIDDGIFIDADQNPSTGMQDGIYPNQNNSLGAEYLVIVGAEGPTIIPYDPSIGQLNFDQPISVAYIDAPVNSSTFVVGIFISNIDSPKTIDCSLSDPDSDWDWVPDSSYCTFALVQYQHDLVVKLKTPQFLVPQGISPLGEQSAILEATLQNCGLNNETNLIFRLLIDGVPVRNASIASLEPGEKYIFKYLFSQSESGRYNLTLYSSPKSGEVVLSNNRRVFILPVLYRVALISDDTSLDDPALFGVLDSIDIGYDVYNYNFHLFDYRYTESLSFLRYYPVVIFNKQNRLLSIYERFILERYLMDGGNLLVTGWDSLSFPNDPRLAALVRSSTVGDDVHMGNLTVVSEIHPIVKGPYGWFYPDYQVTGLFDECDQAKASIEQGAVTVAKLDDRFDKIIATASLPGKVVYWNGEGNRDWVNDSSCQIMFQNTLAWFQTSDLILAGENVVTINNSDLTVNGCIIVKDNATLILQNSNLTMVQQTDFQNRIITRENGKILCVNSTIDSNYYLNQTLFGAKASFDHTTWAIPSVTYCNSIEVLGSSGLGYFRVLKSGSFYGSTGEWRFASVEALPPAIVLVSGCELSTVAVDARNGSFSANGLRGGFIDCFSSYGNLTLDTGSVADVTIINSYTNLGFLLSESEASFVDCENFRLRLIGSEATIVNSSIASAVVREDSMIALINASVVDTVWVLQRSTLLSINATILNCNVLGANEVVAFNSTLQGLRIIGESVLIISNSSLSSLTTAGKAIAVILDSDIFSFRALSYRGILILLNVTIRLFGVGMSDFVIAGSFKVTDQVRFFESNVTRYFDVTVQSKTGNPVADANLTLINHGETLWSGFTDAQGQATFTAVFTEENFFGNLMLTSNKSDLVAAASINLLSNSSLMLTLQEPTIHNLNTAKAYAYIQQAIDDNETLDGHTILVGAGVYEESIYIDKAINLTGTSKSQTIIQSQSPFGVLEIASYNVTVSGFTIQGANTNQDSRRPIHFLNSNPEDPTFDESQAFALPSYNGQTQIGVYVLDDSNVQVINNIITNVSMGINLGSSTNCLIENNTITNCTQLGISLEDSSNITVSRNAISPFRGDDEATSEFKGIELWSSTNTQFSHNNITGSIIMEYSGGNVLRNNSISTVFDAWGEEINHYDNTIDTSNTVNGKPIYYWFNQTHKTVPSEAGYVGLFNCSDITVKNITSNQTLIELAFTNNTTIQGNRLVSVDVENSNNNTINDNEVSNKYPYWSPIDLSYSNGNTLRGNNITSANGDGIVLDSSNLNSVANNNISNCSDDGIQLIGANNNTLSQNTIKLAEDDGIYLYQSNNNTMVKNNIYNCEYDGIYMSDSDNNTINENKLKGNFYGISLWQSNRNTFSANNVSNCSIDALSLDFSSNNTIIQSIFETSNAGLNFYESTGNVITQSSITGNENGAVTYSSSGNQFYLNNFVNNTNQISNFELFSENKWDNDTTGNYWSNYNGTDANGNGIGDTPFIIDAVNTDNFPLIKPWSPPQPPVTPAQNPREPQPPTISHTLAPTSTPTPTPTPTSTPSPTVPPTPPPESTTISATADNGAIIDLQISGNITGSQMSNVTITSTQSTATTTLSFTLTGESGITGFTNITLPKSAVSYGTTPLIYIDGQPAQDQGYSEDNNNYYVWFAIQYFNTHKISTVFTATPSSTPSATPNPTTSPDIKASLEMPQEVMYTIVVAAAISVIVAAAFFLRKREKNKTQP